MSDVQSYRCEIHAPLLVASAYVTDANVSSPSHFPSNYPRTRVQFASRAYLASQEFTTNLDDAYKDDASDGPFVTHLIKEVLKVDSIVLSHQVEAHPKIRSYPFSGHYEAHFIIRPPAPSNPLLVPGPVQVDYQFTVRGGCSVSVTAADDVGVRVVVTLDQKDYVSPPLPSREDRVWTRSDLDDLRPSAGTDYMAIELLNGLLGSGLHGIEVMELLGIKTDVYEPVSASVDLHDSHHAASGFLGSLPVGAGVNKNDRQVFPVYGWLEIGHVPPRFRP